VSVLPLVMARPAPMLLVHGFGGGVSAATAEIDMTLLMRINTKVLCIT
jgi:hypothetical protein